MPTDFSISFPEIAFQKAVSPIMVQSVKDIFLRSSATAGSSKHNHVTYRRSFARTGN